MIKRTPCSSQFSIEFEPCVSVKDRVELAGVEPLASCLSIAAWHSTQALFASGESDSITGDSGPSSSIDSD